MIFTDGALAVDDFLELAFEVDEDDARDSGCLMKWVPGPSS